MNLAQKIESRQGVIAVIGLGYVGLPLAVNFAKAGFQVIGIDTNQARVDAINRGESYVSDIESAQVAALTTAHPSNGPLTRSEPDSESRHRMPAIQPSTLGNANRLSATTDFDVLHNTDAVIICVPTPLDESKNPDMSHIIAVTDEISQRLHRDMLVILESTTYPGTTGELVLPHLQVRKYKESEFESVNGRVKAAVVGEATPAFSHVGPPLVSEADQQQLVVGEDFYLAFSPERIDPGRIDYTVDNTPKVIGGVTSQCTKMAKALYECAIKHIVPVSSPEVAEMVKLLENTFRAVNIALVNEVAIMCDQLGIDVWEVIEAAKTKPFGFMPFYPGPGLGGHCIPIDPQYLAWKLKLLNYNARFIQLAAEVNFNMPQYVLGKIADALNEAAKALNGSRVLILGVAYKADIGDLRESPALNLIHLLQEKGAIVTYHDPYVPHMNVDGLKMTSESLNHDTLQAADCVVIATAHSYYDWNAVVQHSQLVVDTRNATKDETAGQARIVKL
ncbi:MAG: nucleotide sugar dehydrogenase [Anaerolineae bacterium]|nr:nucleotide sugar dehydrogenase [Anaerolineae bacterium]